MDSPKGPEASGDAEARPPFDPTDVIRAIRAAIPTSRHAQMLFDMVAGDLGQNAFVETGDERTRFTLHRTEAAGSDAFVPSTLLSLGTKGRLGTIIPLLAPPGVSVEPPPRPGKAPPLRNLGPAEIMIHDGLQSITVTYGEDGRWMETSRSASIDAFAGVVEALSKTSAHATDLLAAYVGGIDLGRHGPGRVLFPVPLPGGVGRAWNQGLYAIRTLLFEEGLPKSATWVVADGFAGTALAWGASREEALDAWRAEVRKAQPRPVKPPPPPEDEEEPEPPPPVGPDVYGATVRIRGPVSDIPWPEPAPENTPAVVIPLAPLPSSPHPWGSWVRLLGRHGTTYPVLVRQDPGGFTLVGDRLAEAIDLDEIDERLAAAPPLSAAPPGVGRPDYDCQTETYVLVDDDTHEPVPAKSVQSQAGWGFHARELDGDQLRWRVFRQRWFGAR